MKKLKCIKELDVLYDFRQYMFNKGNRIKNDEIKKMHIAMCCVILDEYINKMYPPIKKEK